MEEYATRAIKDPTLDQSRGLGRHTQAEVVSVKLCNTTYHYEIHWLAYSVLTCTITFKLGLQPAMESLVRG